jgi:tetratricopeptide (TPR) repeat protein
MILRRPALFAMPLLLLLAALAYAPGLRGGFLFDDFVNLDALGATGPVDNWASLWRYLSSGGADPTGRPLALLSFLVDAHDWPAEALPFLRTNVMLHLFNGLLLFALLRSLGRRLDGPGRRVDAAAAFGAGAWMLHPLLVSTTLYVVQREAMLPATFVLAGLLAWLRGNRLYAEGRTRIGVGWMCAGILGGTALATLCKANGVLLPVMALAIDATVLDPARGRTSGTPTRWRIVLLVLPTLLFAAYLLMRLRHLGVVIPFRGWSPAQRLLTEPRVLVDYLQLWFVPRSVSTGLYNDGYQVSTSLLHPVSTLPCLLFVLAAPLAAWRWRRRAPALAAAVLFYAAGQLLESTVLPLELYFEHRNYVPSLLLCWPIGRALASAPWPRLARIAVASGVLLLLAVTTYQRTSMWGDPDQLARLWALQNPDSPRAQATLATIEANDGHTAQALSRLEKAWKSRPGELQLALNYGNVACISGGLPPAAARRIGEALRQARYGLSTATDWLGSAIDTAREGSCTGLGFAEVDAWLTALEANPLAGGHALGVEATAPLRARLALANNDAQEASRQFDRALAAWTTPDLAAAQASMLARNGHYREALAHLDYYDTLPRRRSRPAAGMPWVHEQVLERQHYWPHEFAVLRAKLREEIARQPQLQR